MASLAPKSGALGRRLAAHLLRRTVYGPTRQEIDSYAAMTADEAVESLFVFPSLPDHPVDPKTGETWVLTGRTGANSSDNELKTVVTSWWLYQLFDPTQPISAFNKVVFFLHTCFSTSWKGVTFSEHYYYTLRLFMHYATGSYKRLAYKICFDNGMNEYLDIGESIVGNPNENFPREFFELFTILKGPQIDDGDYTNFTEDDIREASKLLTGFRQNTDWTDPLLWDTETGLPTAKPVINRHDITDKTFSHAFQNQTIIGRNTEEGMLEEVSDLVDMIFAQDATAMGICRKLYRYFVRTKISEEVERDIITPMAATFRSNDYQLIAPLKQLLKSQHFFDEDNQDASNEIVGALIKSPLDLQAGIIRYFNVQVPDPAVDPFESYITFLSQGVNVYQSRACFDLFAPPDVAGYEPVFQPPEYNRLWVSAKSIPDRYEFADLHLISGVPLVNIDILAWIKDDNNIIPFDGPDPSGNPGPHQGARIAQHLVTELLDYLLPEPVSNERFNYFLNDLLLDNLSELNWMNEWDTYIGSGDEMGVKNQIVKLVRGILQSPEYQIG